MEKIKVRSNLKKLLIHPLLRDADLDAPETITIVSEIIEKKSFLKQLYQEWYLSILEALPNGIPKSLLELGSGGGFFEQYLPDLIKSEILQTPDVDIVFDGQLMPFRKDSLHGIFMLDVLHHIPNSIAFFKEAARCVKKGGTLIMIEPWVTNWSRFVYRKLHHEPFDINAHRWEFPRGGPLSQANLALPWIIFHRDRIVFQKEFSEWKIREIKLHTPFAYLLSGGVSLRSFVPGFSFPICRFFEHILKPLMKSLAMFATIILERDEKQEAPLSKNKMI